MRGVNAARAPLAALLADYQQQPAHEGLEATFAALLAPDLPPHEFNAYVGPYEADVLFPAQRVIVELDDVRTHRTARAFQRDRERDAALAALGYIVLRFTHRRLEHDAPAALRQLRAVLVQRSGSSQLRSVGSD